MQEKSSATSSHDRILQAAKHLFAQRGYENTSTIMIARAAGTSESQLVKHFGSKYGLLEAIFDLGWQAIGDLFQSTEDSTTAVQRVIFIMERVLEGLNRDPEIKKLMLLESRRISKQGNAVLITQGFLAFTRQLDALLERMRDQGELQPGLPPQAVRSALIGICEGMLRDELAASHNSPGSGYTVVDVKRIVELFVRSVVTEQTRSAH